MSKKVANALKALQDYSRLRGHIKFGQTDVKETFEQNFYNLAQTIISEYFPSLLPYAVGFQLVEKSKDNSKAFAIYGFRLKSLAFIPFFFDNGRVFGYEIIFLPRLNLFLPTTESWISYLRTKGRNNFGRPLFDLNFKEQLSQPDLLPLRRPVILTGGGLNLEDTVKISSLIKQAAKARPRVDYFDIVLKSKKLASHFLALIDRYPTLFDKVVRIHGINLIKKALAVAGARPGLEPKPSIRVFTELDIDRLPLDVSIVNAIKRRGFYIQDNRSKFASLIPAISTKRFQLITGTGSYEVVTPSGEIIRGFVVIPHHSSVGFLLPIGGKQIYYFDVKPKSDVYAINHVFKPKYSDIYRRLPKISREELTAPAFWAEHILRTNSEQLTTRPIGMILLLDKTGNSVLLRGHLTESDGLEQVELSLHQHIVPGVEEFCEVRVVPTHRDNLTFRIFVREGRRICYLGIPKDVRYVPIPDHAERLVTIAPEDIYQQMDEKQIREVKIAHYQDQDLYVINNSPGLNRLQALVELMHMGLKQRDAAKALNDAVRYKQASFWIKPAAAFTVRNTENPTVYFYEEPHTTIAPGYPAKTPIETSYVVPGLRRPRREQELVPPVDSRLIQIVTKLDEVNEGEVFDAGVFTILLRTSRDEYLIDLYIPQLIKSLDTLGRLLFNLYYHREFLQERYGESDYIKLLDSVKKNLESLGDLVIDLMQQDIDYYAGLLNESSQEVGSVEHAI